MSFRRVVWLFMDSLGWGGACRGFKVRENGTICTSGAYSFVPILARVNVKHCHCKDGALVGYKVHFGSEKNRG